MIRSVFKKIVDRHIFNHYENPEYNGFFFGGMGAFGGMVMAAPSDNFMARSMNIGGASIIGGTMGFFLGATLGPFMFAGAGFGICATAVEQAYIHVEKILTVSS